MPASNRLSRASRKVSSRISRVGKKVSSRVSRIAKKVRAGAPGAPTKRTATGKQRRMTGKEYAASRKQEFEAKKKAKRDASIAKGKKRDAESKSKFLQAKADTKKYGAVRTTRLGRLRKINEDAAKKRAARRKSSRSYGRKR